MRRERETLSLEDDAKLDKLQSQFKSKERENERAMQDMESQLEEAQSEIKKLKESIDKEKGTSSELDKAMKQDRAEFKQNL